MQASSIRETLLEENEGSFPIRSKIPNAEFRCLSNHQAIEKIAKAERFDTVEFSEVTYVLGKKQILSGISSSTKAGQVLNVIGPSNCGKSILLNILAGNVQQVSGRFTINGHTKNMFPNLRAGFVIAGNQANYPTNTVKEELEFSSLLRLASFVTKKQRQELTDDLLVSLGLVDVGSRQVKTLTIFEKKRLAIGVELASIPNLLLVDDPLAGLEPSEGMTIMRILQAIARTKACGSVIVTHRNPGSHLYSEIDDVLLLGPHGRMIYQGTPGGLYDAFASKHLRMPNNCNPFDFAVYCASVLPDASLPDGSRRVDMTLKQVDSLSPEEIMTPRNQSELCAGGPKRHRNVFVEFQALLVRETRATIRHPRMFFARLIANAIVMTLCACVFIDSAEVNHPNYFVGSHFGSFVFPMFSSSYSTMVPVIVVIHESKRAILRERVNHTYGSLPYALARIVPELIVTFMIATVSVAILYFAAGWNGNFMMIILAFFLLFETCTSYAYFLAYTTSNVIISSIGLVVVALTPQLLFTGTFVRITSLPGWLQWVTWVCNITYALRIVITAEFTDMSQCNSTTSSVSYCRQWQAFAESNTAAVEDLWVYILVMVSMFAIFRVLAFMLANRQVNKARRFGLL